MFPGQPSLPVCIPSMFWHIRKVPPACTVIIRTQPEWQHAFLYPLWILLSSYILASPKFCLCNITVHDVGGRHHISCPYYSAPQLQLQNASSNISYKELDDNHVIALNQAGACQSWSLRNRANPRPPGPSEGLHGSQLPSLSLLGVKMARGWCSQKTLRGIFIALSGVLSRSGGCTNTWSLKAKMSTAVPRNRRKGKGAMMLKLLGKARFDKALFSVY